MPSSQPPAKKRGNPDLPPGLKPGQYRDAKGVIRTRGKEKKVLSTRTDGELAAMRWVETHGPEDDETWEQKSKRSFRESNPATFYARMARLVEQEEERQKAGVPPGTPEWDGEGDCPCCGRKAEKAIEDEGTAKILAMLEELNKS